MSVSIGHTIYVQCSAQAVPFYLEVFGLTLGYHVKNADGSFFHSELCSGKQSVLCVAEVIDRYGVWWYLTAPQHKPDDSFDPDRFEYNRI